MRAWLAVVLLFGCVPFVLAQKQTSPSEPQLKPRSAAEAHSTALPDIPGAQCITFDPEKLTVEEILNGPKVTGEAHWLLFVHSSGRPNEGDARAVLKIIQHHGMNASCWVEGRVDPHGLHFMLADGKPPVSEKKILPIEGHECYYHKLKNLRVIEIPKEVRVESETAPSSRFAIEDKSYHNYMFGFASRSAADLSLAIMRRFGITGQCYYGNPINMLRFFGYLTAR